MSDELLKELENLRAENKILRDSLTMDIAEESDDGAKSIEKILCELGRTIAETTGKVKESLSPGTEKLTETLRHQMEKNPVPVILAAFGTGFLVGRRFDRK